MANHNNNSELVDEKQALSQFFTSLLTDTEEQASEPVEFKTEPEIDNSVLVPTIPIEITEPVPEVVTTTDDVVVDPNVVIETKDVIVEEITPIIGAEPETDPTSHIIDGEFQIMMFKTAGLTLAVPLVELSGVITWPENITEMPGHKNSYLGIVQHLDKKVPIIDIAQIVFPQDRIASIVNSNAKNRLQRIVFINDFKWGLACDAVEEVITINSEQIKWRKTKTKRAWLAGTVVEHMCALLDIQELSVLLSSEHS